MYNQTNFNSMAPRIIKLLLMTGWIVIACREENITGGPESKISGNWTLIQRDDLSVATTDYMTFLPDSILTYSSLNEGPSFSGNKYVINDSILYIGQFSPNGFSGYAYNYEFIDRNTKLKLIPNYSKTTPFISISPIPVTVYKRVR